MAQRNRVTRHGRLEEARAWANRPDLVRVRTTIATVARGEGALVEVVDRQPDLDIMFHVPSGRRWIRDIPDMRGRELLLSRLHPDGTDGYDRQAERADVLHDVELKAAEHTLDLLTDTQTTIIAATGAARSMKTHTGTGWLFRQWMLRGGPGVLGWMIAPELALAILLKDKFCVGEGPEVPPVCPRGLWLKAPDDEKAAATGDPYIWMLDGTRIRLLHTRTKGANMPGRSVAFWQWTEAAETKEKKNYVRARGRLVSSKGQGYLDAVPEARNWVRYSIIDVAEEEHDKQVKAAANGEDYRPHIRVANLSTKDNPYNSEAEAGEFEADLRRVDPALADREAKGIWAGDNTLIFCEVFDTSSHTFDLESWKVEDIRHAGLVDITGQASLRLFAREHEWLVAADINARPHTALIGKIACKRDDNPREWLNWHLVLFDLLQSWDMDSLEAAEELASIHGGKFRGAGVIMDATSCLKRHNAGGRLNKKLGMIPRQAYERVGFEVKPAGRTSRGKPENPPLFDGTIVCRRLFRENIILINRVRCRRFVRALREQEDAGDGITPAKLSNTDQDRYIASCTDTFRYFAWPFFSKLRSNTKMLTAREYA